LEAMSRGGFSSRRNSSAEILGPHPGGVIELWMGSRLALGASGRDRNPEPQEQVFDDLNIAGSGLALDLAFAGDVADIQNGAVGQTDGFQKTREIADVSCPPCRRRNKALRDIRFYVPPPAKK
jgi:hypothetical protein